MFISEALAQAAPAADPTTSLLVNVLPFILILGIMYFLIIRPQQKRMKEHREMVASVRRGDIVVTAGGIIGKVAKVSNDNEIQVEIADGVRVRVVKSTLTDVRSKTEVRESRRARDEEEDDRYDNDDEEDETPEAEEPPRKPVKAANENRAAAALAPARTAPARPAQPARRGKSLPPSKRPGRTLQAPVPTPANSAKPVPDGGAPAPGEGKETPERET